MVLGFICFLAGGARFDPIPKGDARLGTKDCRGFLNQRRVGAPWKRKEKLPRRFYILFVARGEDGQLRKIPIPTRYLYVLVVGAVIGLLGMTGLASSYVRMLTKVSSYN